MTSYGRGYGSSAPDRRSTAYEAYAAITGAFLGGIGLAGRVPDAARFRRPLACVVQSGTHTCPRRSDELLRDPFVDGKAHEGDEEESGDLRQAIGELVTCSRCGGTWAAAGLAISQILAPRSGRLLTWHSPQPAQTTSSRRVRGADAEVERARGASGGLAASEPPLGRGEELVDVAAASATIRANGSVGSGRDDR